MVGPDAPASRVIDHHGRKVLHRWLGGLLAFLLISACAPQDAAEDPTPADAGPEAGREGVPYELTIEGVEDEELRGLLDEVSESRRLIDRPPPSLTRLRRRAEDDQARLEQALRSHGYYDATIEIAIDADAEPVRVVFRIAPGPVYRLRNVALEVSPPDADLPLPSLEEMGIAPGSPAVAQTILDAETTLVERAEERGFALAKAGERRAVVDHDADAMDLTLRLDTGPLVRFGTINVTGLSEVERDFVEKRLPWQPGELITSERLAEGQRALRETGLFTMVRTEIGDTPDAEGRVPVAVEVSERKHRSIEVGVRYRTDEGPGGNIAWEHRNFFGRGEQVQAELDASPIAGLLALRFRKPDVWIRDLALLSDVELAYEAPDAYDSRSASARVALERRFREGMTLTGGLAFRASQVEEANTGREDSFGLVSLPAEFNWDRSDDLLDPTRGGRLSVENEPFVDVFGNDLAFNKSRLAYAHYLQVLEAPRVVLAGRTAVGTLFGASRADVPADLRFYAGGGGSVRGFAFQTAGELDDEDDPIGGRSLFEVSGEVRVRVTDTIGLVAFVDAGAAFTSSVPDFDEELRIGAGPGLRYFSPIGPLRLDVGFPVNPRNSDDAFQLYISIGQAF
ncbi:MAG TPA: autotransporter assembly complex family protein [Geminicoccaceae bacterium]|nr:autotransporter assembly complex family protein [Geminicoccaceae bacterium]